jgi:hypothetical protein
VFLVGSLPIFLIAYASLAMSVEIIVSWLLQNACQYLLAGASVGLVADLGRSVQQVNDGGRGPTCGPTRAAQAQTIRSEGDQLE